MGVRFNYVTEDFKEKVLEFPEEQHELAMELAIAVPEKDVLVTTERH